MGNVFRAKNNIVHRIAKKKTERKKKKMLNFDTNENKEEQFIALASRARNGKYYNTITRTKYK